MGEPEKLGTRIRRVFREHQAFSGAAVGIPLVLVTLIGVLVTLIGVTAAIRSSDNEPGSTAVSSNGNMTRPIEPTVPESEPKLDADEDGVPDDGTDECEGEAGIPPSGCPDDDEDRVPNNQDECDEVKALTENGCPEKPQITVTRMGTIIENNDPEYDPSENAPPGSIWVDGIPDPWGIRMQVRSSSAEFRLATSQRYQRIRGKVGITSQPCSAGSIGYVAILDAEEQQIWPVGEGLAEVGLDAVPFNIPIGSENAIILYAEAPDTGPGCGENLGSTEVGWVKTELVSTE